MDTHISDIRAAPLKEQTVEFRDGPKSWDMGMVSRPDPTFDEAGFQDANLATFLSRPVKIRELSWAVGALLSDNFNPWNLFFNNPDVANRISNFNLLRCMLNVKFLINGNSFYYGRTVCSYNPFDLTNEAMAGVTDVILLTQRPNVLLNPTSSEGGTLNLPFFFHKNWFHIPTNDWEQMGRIYVQSINSLEHANGGTDPVTVSIFAWAENVRLCVPTTNVFVPQAGFDEFSTNPISSVATAVAKASGALTIVPVIAPFAKATAIAANAVGSIAKMFGFSRPNILEKLSLFKPMLMGNLAATDLPEAGVSLSLDSKCELTVDPRTVGLFENDDLSIQAIVSKECTPGLFIWSLSDAPESFLFAVNVHPVQFGIGITSRHPTPMAFVSQLFQYWTGSIKIRFQVVCSDYHKGRLRITYDPNVYNPGVASPYNVAYTKIIDLAKERDVTMTINWAQPEAYKKVMVLSSAPGQFSSGAPPPYIAGDSNGTVSVYVMNALTVPNSSIPNDVSVNFWVSGGEDLEFASPDNSKINSLVYFEPQAAYEPLPNEPEQKSSEVEVGTCTESPSKNLVFMGETIVSLRQLLRRYSFHSLFSTTSVNTASARRWRLRFNNVPNYVGFDPTGISTNGGFPYNYSRMTIMNYIMPAFAAWRGSIRYKYVTVGVGGTNTTNMNAVNSLVRSPGFGSYQNQKDAIFIGSETINQHLSKTSLLQNTASGAYATTSQQQPCTEISLPFYSRFRLAFARILSNNSGSSSDDTNAMGHTYDSMYSTSGNTDHGTMVMRYVATGEDFSLFFFTGAPYIY